MLNKSFSTPLNTLRGYKNKTIGTAYLIFTDGIRPVSRNYLHLQFSEPLQALNEACLLTFSLTLCILLLMLVVWETADGADVVRLQTVY
jgi:hypothetical protein